MQNVIIKKGVVCIYLHPCYAHLQADQKMEVRKAISELFACIFSFPSFPLQARERVAGVLEATKKGIFILSTGLIVFIAVSNSLLW